MNTFANFLGYSIGFNLAGGLFNRFGMNFPGFDISMMCSNPFIDLYSYPAMNFGAFPIYQNNYSAMAMPSPYDMMYSWNGWFNSFDIPFMNYSTQQFNSQVRGDDTMYSNDYTWNSIGLNLTRRSSQEPDYNYTSTSNTTDLISLENTSGSSTALNSSSSSITQTSSTPVQTSVTSSSQTTGTSSSQTVSSSTVKPNKPSASTAAQNATRTKRSTKTYSNEHKYDDLINKYAEKYNIEPDFIRAVIKQESGFNPNALGPETKYGRAKGLMQLMPGTAKDYGVTDAYDPEQNIRAGTEMLSRLSKRYNGNKNMILAAYNWGIGNLSKKGYDNRPAETRNYINKVLGYYNEYKSA